MKAKLFLALFALTVCCFYSCGLRDSEPMVPAQYNLLLEIVDQNGNNVLDGHPTMTIKEASGRIISTSDSKLMSDKILIVNSHSNSVIADRSDETLNYLWISSDSYSPQEYPSEVTWEIQCKEVYADEKIHKVESTWSDDKKNIARKCTAINFDGKDYIVTQQSDRNYARVVVSR